MAASEEHDKENDVERTSNEIEWPGYKHLKKPGGSGVMIIGGPFLITELHRLEPFMDGSYISFRPRNMPYLKVKKINIVGMVMSVRRDTRSYEYRVEDGTAVISVYFKKTEYELYRMKRLDIDKQYRYYAQNGIDRNFQKGKDYERKFPKPRPNFKYPLGTSYRDMAILENNWWSATNNGLLGKDIEPFDYIYVEGYLYLDYEGKGAPKNEADFQSKKLGKFVFTATHLNCISEAEYNTKIQACVTTGLEKRYIEPSTRSQYNHI